MKKAFTLAEVMIVLAIIGILVAILLPTAQNLTPDEALMKFQKNNTNLASAIRNLTNSEEYFYNGDFGLDRDNNPITEPKYFCGALAEILTYKKINCSEDNLGYNSSALANLPDMLTMEIDGENITDIADCMCKNNLTSGEEIILNDGTIIYTINPYYHFGSLIDGSDKRLFNLCSKEKRYKYICMDIDGLDNGEDPFGYALRADGKMIYGSRAQAWIERKINRKEDEEIVISSIDSCEPIALSITPENDTCVAPPSVVYPSVTPTPTPTPEIPVSPENFTYTYEGGTALKSSTDDYIKITLTSSGVFTPLANMNAIIFALGGGGGGGASCNAYVNTAKDGCSGNHLETEYTFVKNTPINVIIGAGGASGGECYTIEGGENGHNGEDTSFGSIVAQGGGGGSRGNTDESDTLNCSGGATVTFADVTYADSSNRGENMGTGGVRGSGGYWDPRYAGKYQWIGNAGASGNSGIVVIKIPKN